MQTSSHFGDSRRLASWIATLAILPGLLGGLSQMARAATFTDTFSTDPIGGGAVTSFTRTLGGVSYTFTFSGTGDGGDFVYDTGNGVGGSASIYPLSASPNTGTTERITIARTDTADFTFSGIFVNNAFTGTAVTVGGYNNGSLVGSAQSVNAANSASLNFGTTNVDEVRITATDIDITFDDFSGDTDPTYVAPTLTATGGNPTFTEGGSALDLFGTVSAATNGVGETFGGMTLTVTNVSNGSSEILAIGGTAVALTHGNSGTLTGIGSFSVSVTTGTATVTLSSMSRSDAQLGTLVDGMTYRNTSDDPGSSSRVVTITGISDSGASTNTASLSLASTVAVTPVNDAPTLTATGGTPTFTEGGSAVDLYSSVSISTVEVGQLIEALTLTITNLANGSSELLGADGSSIVLTHGASGNTATNGMSYTVSVTGSTATLTLDSAGISVASAQTLVDGLTYRNTSDSPDTTNRVVTLTSIVDSHGTGNGGADTATLSIAATVAVVAVNDQPTDITLSASSVNQSAGANATVGTLGSADPDAGDTFSYSLVAGAGDTDNASFNISGSTLRATAPGSLSAGAKSVRIRTTDSGSLTFDEGFSITVVDDVAPAAPSTPDLATASDTGASSSDNITSDTTPTFTGTAEIGSTVRVLDGAVEVGSAVADGSGNWSVTTSVLGDGVHTITATATDAAANVSAASSGLSATVDTSAPSAPSTPDLATASDTGASTSDNITSDTTPTFTGTAEIGSTVKVLDGATQVGLATTDGSGNWSVTTSALGAGVHAITATATDVVDQASVASTGLSVTVDTTAPTAPAFSSISNDTGASSSDQVTSDTTLVLTGVAEAGGTVTVFRNASPVGTTTADGGGDWSFDYSATTLAAGTHTFTATTADAAGNTGSASPAFLVEIDTATPSAPVITAMADDTGAGSSDGITSDNRLVLSGTAEAGAIITVSRSGAGVIGTATANGSGGWSFDYTGVALADGAHLFTAFASDTAGNASAVSADFAVTIDTIVPAIATQPVGGTYVAGGSFVLSVGATDAGVLSFRWYLGASALSDSANRTGSTTATLTHSSIGTTGFDGSYTVVVTDVAGNASTSAAAVVLVNKADQTITFPAIADTLTTSSPFTVSATASTGFAVTFSVVSGPATVSGATVTVTGAGTVTIRASQAGDLNTNPAAADRTFAVTKAVATVTLSNLSHVYDGTTRSASATTLPGGLTLQFTYDGGATAPVNAGSYAVVATIDDATYQGSSSGTLLIAKASQSVAFAPIPTATVGSPVTLSATASSGLAVAFSVVSGDATVSGSTLTVHGDSTITVRATQAGSGNFNAASADQTVGTIIKLAQAITFAQPAGKMTSDAPFSLTATASSGLAVSYSVLSGPAAISGNTVTLSGAPGTVSIVAHQAGNAAYLPAADVSRSFAVTAPLPPTAFGTINSGAQARGTFALHLATDGSSGVLLGYVPNSGGFVVNFTPNVNGAFVATAQVLTPAPTTGPLWTFRGQITGGSFTGSIDEPALTLAGVFDPVTGPTAAIAGYYMASALDATTGVIHTIVGTTGKLFVLAVLPDLVDGDAGTVDAGTGDFLFPADSGVVIDGHAQAPDGTIDGAITRVSLAATGYAGLRQGTERTDRLANLSSRASVGSGDNVAVTGFVVGGAASKEVLLRAIGPSLADFGVTGAMADPRMTLIRDGSAVAVNDNWGAAANAADIAAAFVRTGAFAVSPTSKDAAILLVLQPGSYTAIVEGVGGVGGIALAEVYDASVNPSAEYQRLVNISTRGFAGPGDATLVGGFVVSGNAPKRVLVRGVGPTLAGFGVTGVLADPSLLIFKGATVVAQNGDWGAGPNTAAELSAAATATGAFALTAGSKDAAILVTLAPGVYTTHVTSAAGGTGVALVEVYELP